MKVKFDTIFDLLDEWEITICDNDGHEYLPIEAKDMKVIYIQPNGTGSCIVIVDKFTAWD